MASRSQFHCSDPFERDRGPIEPTKGGLACDFEMDPPIVSLEAPKATAGKCQTHGLLLCVRLRG